MNPKPPAPSPAPAPARGPDDELADLDDAELDARCCQNFCKYCVKVRAARARARRAGLPLPPWQ
ncbi:hypothetical protein [Plasticicumulans sp.]|uniref:hypothetical protein n=1 Tax=Plasticicumulans sp. TaxID=2307179 RepID=UPI000FA6BA76|nr:hypothetical protein [Plasticicumulans sp.]MBS0603211.1 hypothetical protein [Pseudomonadota bacterium]RTK95867.1 MAG: hypothetical protein EKK65_14720 [Xanthomonadales bacterium]HMW28569.1 hypothetical protein [Plasticicumulans sp.]HNB89694.1 hypothetical protein [Plasticicumulans sp.]HNE02322.1 hypothetical protein [Plasticicumulans sp.]